MTTAVATKATRAFAKKIFAKGEKLPALDTFSDRFSDDAELTDSFRRFTSAISDFEAEVSKPVRIPKIDWDFYENNIRTPGIVASFRKLHGELSQLKAPQVNEEALWEPYLGQMEAAYEEALKFVEDIDRSIADIDAEIDALNVYEARLDTITVEEELQNDPAAVDEIIDDINHDRWDVEEFENVDTLAAAAEKKDQHQDDHHH